MQSKKCTSLRSQCKSLVDTLSLRNLLQHISRRLFWTLEHHPVGNGAQKRGIICIQIDGLSRHQFQRAVRNKKMPFCASLQKSRAYTLHSFYSGIPSTTPAVQGELFYGKKQAVPAFSFRKQNSDHVSDMLSTAFAASIQKSLCRQTDSPLLRAGSSQGNIYTGGAEHARYCAASPGLSRSDAFSTRRIRAALMPLLMAPWIGLLMAIEIILGIIDSIKGALSLGQWHKELQFILTRSLVSILMRQLCTSSVVRDVKSNLPIIHVNYLGYDEHAHRRGPGSKFAHWTLKGIDKQIQRIWKHAAKSPAMTYDVWIYSDHGQQEVEPFIGNGSLPLSKQIQNAFEKAYQKIVPVKPPARFTPALRLRQIGSRILNLLPWTSHTTEHTKHIQFADKGPVGHIYIPSHFSSEKHSEMASTLSRSKNIPCVGVKIAGSTTEALVYKNAKAYHLPRDAAQVFGPAHYPPVCHDTISLMHHPDAGDLVIFGWCWGETATTFSAEHGAHGGFGPQETHAFALLPTPIALPPNHNSMLRPLELRTMIQRELHKNSEQPSSPLTKSKQQLDSGPLKVCTWNLHGCVDMNGRVKIDKYISVCKHISADVFLLQEVVAPDPAKVECNHLRTIAQALGYHYCFFPLSSNRAGLAGLGILSRMPAAIKQQHQFTTIDSKEPRGILRADLLSGDFQSIRAHLFCTHLGLYRGEQKEQVREILGHQLTASPDCTAPVVIGGDFNCPPQSKTYREICGVFSDAGIHTTISKEHLRTLHGLVQLDYLFIDNRILLHDIECVDDPHTRSSSDHLPLVATFSLSD